tara:strand:- start:159 stop:395 length:237 start_codon:yes stop_codon:yes gene_type:complete
MNKGKNKKILSEYIVVSSVHIIDNISTNRNQKHKITSLSEIVNNNIKNGYVPIGIINSVYCSDKNIGTSFYQSMIKYN